MNKRIFSIIGCQHEHISIFIEEMLDMGHQCIGIYENENMRLANEISHKYDIPLVSSIPLLLGEEVDVVGCASINNEKIDVIELCEKHGISVMLDKPAVTNTRDLNRLHAVMQRGNIQIGMLLTERYRPTLCSLKQRIIDGVYGEIVHISMRKPHMLKPASRPSWHFSKEQSGGIIIDLFVHDFDLLRWLTSQDIISALGFMSKRILPEYPDFFDASGLQVLLEGGVSAQLYADWHTPESCWTYGDGRIFVVGTEGTAELRLAGDPLSIDAGLSEILLEMTRQQSWKQVISAPISKTITNDFLARIDGQEIGITHKDIFATTKATLDADETAIQVIR